MKKQFIAHLRKKDREPQYLCSHLTRVSVLTGQFAAKINLKEAGRIIGLLHDLGKASDAFDKYIKSATGIIDPDADDYVDAPAQKGKIDHSSAGAQVIYSALSTKGPEGIIAGQILALTIASHHSGLIDCLSPDGRDIFTRRIEKAREKTHADEAFS
ncbi:MAG TPA: CRISPR-associated endonuclease Cas3'', partial [Bacteroidota bacterium]|nr:CRISPR-associated endonuclease Cas3'' [Bacteroidota bacterium]